MHWSADYLSNALPLCSKSVGYRFGKHLGRAVPLAIRYLRGAAEGDEELREYCLQVEAGLLRQWWHAAALHYPTVVVR